ncbi:hypothetical protein BD779DRAFT_1483134 [Infundibulicybe gibba]|nr:hypothetical protein BD779DRAFT_1483134 [Infundibulicybe gibba]
MYNHMKTYHITHGVALPAAEDALSLRERATGGWIGAHERIPLGLVYEKVNNACACGDGRMGSIVWRRARRVVCRRRPWGVVCMGCICGLARYGAGGMLVPDRRQGQRLGWVQTDSRVSDTKTAEMADIRASGANGKRSRSYNIFFRAER